jgi:hypothetical protein
MHLVLFLRSTCFFKSLLVLSESQILLPQDVILVGYIRTNEKAHLQHVENAERILS